MDTYTDTWGKLVKFLVVRKFISGNDTIYTIAPDFENIQYIDVTEPPEEIEEPTRIVSEEFHLEDVSQIVKDNYMYIKKYCFKYRRLTYLQPSKVLHINQEIEEYCLCKISKQKDPFCCNDAGRRYTVNSS
jgi:hypothetical protein